MKFTEKLDKIVSKNNSLLCVGLDIDKEKMPKFLFESSKNPYLDFNKSIIDSTKDLVCAYKLNMAFYEVLGKDGFDILAKTIAHIPDDIVVILDGKALKEKLLDEITLDVAKATKKYGRKPGLATVLVGEDNASKMYIDMKKKACERVGIYSLNVSISAGKEIEDIKNEIVKLNNNNKIDGILLQLPSVPGDQHVRVPTSLLKS